MSRCNQAGDTAELRERPGGGGGGKGEVGGNKELHVVVREGEQRDDEEGNQIHRS